jgi:hypothetical protein
MPEAAQDALHEVKRVSDARLIWRLRQGTSQNAVIRCGA